MKKKKSIYVLGTGLSHDGSACLIKDGKIAVAIEKERISRRKHDGMNDTLAIEYCLQKEGISVNDLSLVVQNANMGSFEFGNDHFYGKRLFDASADVPVVTISHHLAHAYNAIGTSPFKETAVLVIDGCGSLFDECIDLHNSILPQKIDPALKHLYAEKDSFYDFKDNTCTSLFKDFSPWGMGIKEYIMYPTTTQHSIGGLYSAVSRYCFGNVDDAGKLMGLAPYGRPGIFNDQVFELSEGRVFVKYDWMSSFLQPARQYKQFTENFQYYADIAYWIQKEVERAVLYVMNHRAQYTPLENISYTGGVALNAVVNQYIKSQTKFKNVYITPAAGDNGLAIGCAYYGWMEILKEERVMHNGNSCFGKTYPDDHILESVESYCKSKSMDVQAGVDKFFDVFPSCVFPENIQTLKCNLQFIITGCGMYVAEFEKGKCIARKGACLTPDITFTIDGVSFIKWLRQPEYMGEMINSGRLKIEGDFSYLVSWLNMEKIASEIKQIITEFTLDNSSIRYVKHNDIVGETAKLLASGKIIGWFQEGCEFGPRALGHRSILADPRRVDIQKFINAKIKFREDFRPFAPSVLLEDVSEYFQYEGESPYMIMVAQVQPGWKDKIPGVVHVNGSCRIQTVTQEWNKLYYDLLKAFKKETGISVLLNTSFNKRGMPIVETPDEALNFFFECELDCLAIGNYIVYK